MLPAHGSAPRSAVVLLPPCLVLVVPRGRTCRSPPAPANKPEREATSSLGAGTVAPHAARPPPELIRRNFSTKKGACRVGLVGRGASCARRPGATRLGLSRPERDLASALHVPLRSCLSPFGQSRLGWRGLG